MNFITKVKQILKASAPLDTLVYLHSESGEAAVRSLITDLAADLESLCASFGRLEYEAVSKVTNLAEKTLETQNSDFLSSMEDFLFRVDQIFANKAVQYAQICKKFNIPKTLLEQQLVAKEGADYLKKLDVAVQLVNKFAASRLKDFKKRKLDQLPTKQELSKRLRLLTTLTLAEAIRLLKTEGEI